ncbi:MAG: hypothetical protein JRH11_24400 [Deltaproteobacteria bacterium]|nr:hypothetical protein [Deltaproteobacteria bacterium]
MERPKYTRLGFVWRVKHYAPKFLRLTAFFAVLYVALVVAVGYEARAQMNEQMMTLGVDMLRYEGADYQRDPRTLLLNGQAIRLSTGLAPHDLEHVLDYYEGRCMERDGRFADQIAELVDGDPVALEAEARLLDPTLRESDDERGYVACLDTLSDERLDSDGVAAAFQRFQNSLDLSEFGELRYIYAERARDGGTFFVAFWIEGSFKIVDMFPKDVDAPGRDVAGVPRPPSARRILSSWEEGRPQAVTTYVGGALATGELDAFYREEMHDAGWEVIEVDESPLELHGQRGAPEGFLTFEREERMVSLVMSTGADGPVTTVLTHR